MKCVLFCNLPYAFGIYEPLAKELKARGLEYIWYIPKEIEQYFNFANELTTTNLKDIEDFNSDAIFVCGNDVPYWLRGLKVQIFHGLAGEKKGHFRIRGYFDLYLTQGPYFTDRFKELSQKHKNFDVAQTGWCKLDKLFTTSSDTLELKKSLLEKSGAKNIILYAPTFSPSLTSAISLKDTIVNLSKDSNNLVVIKFHDKMDKETIELYKSLQSKNLQVIDSDDITPLLQISDIMISDTSSVVYEFLLLDKPAVTLNSVSEHINWANFSSSDMLYREVTNILQNVDNFKDARAKTIELYHPYRDGKSSARMIDAVQQYIKQNGVPTKRKVPLLRKLKMLKAYKGK